MAATPLRSIGLPARSDMLDYRRQAVTQIVQAFDDLAHPQFEGVQAGPEQRFPLAVGSLLFGCWWGPVAVQDVVKVLRVPAERHRERLQRPLAAAPLHGVVLKFPDDRLRDVRALREFSLTPAELHKTGEHEFLNWMVVLGAISPAPGDLRYFGELGRINLAAFEWRVA